MIHLLEKHSLFKKKSDQFPRVCFSEYRLWEQLRNIYSSFESRKPLLTGGCMQIVHG